MQEDIRSRPSSSRSSCHLMNITPLMAVREKQYSYRSLLDCKMPKGGSRFKRQNKNEKMWTTAVPIIPQQRTPVNQSLENAGFCAFLLQYNVKLTNTLLLLYKSGSPFSNRVKCKKAILPCRRIWSPLGDNILILETQSTVLAVSLTRQQCTKTSIVLVQFTRQGRHQDD